MHVDWVQPDLRFRPFHPARSPFHPPPTTAALENLDIIRRYVVDCLRKGEGPEIVTIVYGQMVEDRVVVFPSLDSGQEARRPWNIPQQEDGHVQTYGESRRRPRALRITGHPDSTPDLRPSLPIPLPRPCSLTSSIAQPLFDGLACRPPSSCLCQTSPERS